jgi:hypothetical protein
MRHGFGLCEFPDGSVYKGLWENDMMHGMGTLIEDDGTKFVGNFNKGEFGGRYKSISTHISNLTIFRPFLKNRIP